MFNSVQNRTRSAGAAIAIDIAPLIDVVFILLIFFLVTATFVRDTGIQVRRPQASASRGLEPNSLRISIAESGAIYHEGQQLELPQLQDRVRQAISRQADLSVIVIPDDRVSAGRLVAVMDAAKLAGAKDVAIATKRKGSS